MYPSRWARSLDSAYTLWYSARQYHIEIFLAMMAEMIVPKIKSALNPITALTFLALGTSKSYLLAGQGQFLKIFDHWEMRLIHTERIFDSQAIHGIACESLPQDAGNSGTLLIWAGRSICLISIKVHLDRNEEPFIEVYQRTPEVLWDDWILHGCFRPVNVADSGGGSNTVGAILVTAHNDLLWLKSVDGMAETRGDPWLRCIASGPSSILYSAHMVWVDAGRRLLVAAGTLFGEVLLWSCIFDHYGLWSTEICLHYRFVGHEGSVFGVRISEVTQAGAVNRLLASCSDDRTIRIWNISDTSDSAKAKRLPDGDLSKSEAGLLETPKEADSTACLAMVMGHASRIWGLRFLTQEEGYWDLMSYGEDCATHTWRVSPILDKVRTIQTPRNRTFQLSHRATYSYHSGKNIWAMAVFLKRNDDFLVATGGADGRLTTYKPFLPGTSARTAAWTSQYKIDAIIKTIQIASNGISPKGNKACSFTENIFGSIKGSWKLSRSLNSHLSTYPSGTLEGFATFTDRPPTDNFYDAEYLYSESGDFITQQGFIMRATRQYVYRYSRTTDTISVWFVKPDDGNTVDYFFHKLDFRETKPGMNADHNDWSASGYHLCVKDNYNAKYSFQWKNSKITQWEAVFDVDGPKKSYAAKATYTRDRAERIESEEAEDVIPPSVKTNPGAFSNPSGQSKPDTFKTYAWISRNEVVVTTEFGNLLVGNVFSITESKNLDTHQNAVWELVDHQTSLMSSSIATSIPSLGIALLTGTDGYIFSYRHCSKELDTIARLPGKAGFLKAHSLSDAWNRWLQSSHQREMIGVFATCLGSSQATVFMFSPNHANGRSTEKDSGPLSIHEIYLTLPSRFVVTSSCFLDGEIWIILGSRNGDIAIYDLARTTSGLSVDISPNYFQHIHGEDAITMIQAVPRDVAKLIGSAAIITAGRDGKWAIHQVFHKCEDSRLFVSLRTIHMGVPPFGPNIEGAYIDPTTEEVFFWGFRSKQFVVWNESQKREVMAVDCGGAHRNWAYISNRGSGGGGSLAYTKASVCHIHSQSQASHHVIQHGGHGREIKTMAASPSLRTNDEAELRFVATGAEDTAIRIFGLNADLECLSILTKHTTGIQQLRWSLDGQLLFSAAGCEEFFVWRLQSAPLVTIGVVCEAQCPTATEEADLRIMGFATEDIHSDHDSDDFGYQPDYLLSIVYSDSSVRVFRYRTSPDQKSFELLTEGSYTTNCLTQVIHLHIGETLSGLCTASTDGHLAFWPLPDLVSDDVSTQTPLRWSTRSAVHQSSVKALASVTLSESETLIVTGGDDGAVAFTRVGICRQSKVPFDTATLILPGGHASAVTGVVLLPENPEPDAQTENRNGNEIIFTLASVGNDQRLKIWNVSIDTAKSKGGVEGITVRRVANVYTSIADASSLETYRDAEGEYWLLVAGIGLERWRSGRLGEGIKEGKGGGRAPLCLGSTVQTE